MAILSLSSLQTESSNREKHTFSGFKYHRWFNNLPRATFAIATLVSRYLMRFFINVRSSLGAKTALVALNHAFTYKFKMNKQISRRLFISNSDMVYCSRNMNIFNE
uniref:Uncharacterized protein n=1 Tax=Cacopsylla melanoneura TaxID=428564 RepID=A0A8D9BX26_9HEMI